MIWKSIIAPIILLISVLILIYMSKRDLEDIQIKKTQKSDSDCPKCAATKLAASTEKQLSIEYIPVQDSDEDESEILSDSDCTHN